MRNWLTSKSECCLNDDLTAASIFVEGSLNRPLFCVELGDEKRAYFMEGYAGSGTGALERGVGSGIFLYGQVYIFFRVPLLRNFFFRIRLWDLSSKELQFGFNPQNWLYGMLSIHLGR